MKTARHVPVRTCVGCGEHDHQRNLFRIAYVSGRGLAIDVRRRLGGRGAYLHGEETCWKRFAARKGMVRSLGIGVDRAARATLVDELRRQVGR